MSLLTTYGAHNRVEEQSLDIRYKKTRISGQWSWSAIATPVGETFYYMWECHRYATKSFRYVGMTKDTADQCKRAMVSKYTRSFRMSRWRDDCMNGEWIRQSGGSQPMAEVSASLNEDGSYDVIVNVNEDDAMMAMEAGGMDFATEKLRTYEGGEMEVS